MRQIDPSDVLAYVMEHTDATREQAEACLAIQDEYMVAVGIMYSPVGEEWPFRYYSEAEREALSGRGCVVDTLAMARDCVRLVGVPEEVAHAVYAAETEFVAWAGALRAHRPWPVDGVPKAGPVATGG